MVEGTMTDSARKKNDDGKKKPELMRKLIVTQQVCTGLEFVEFTSRMPSPVRLDYCSSKVFVYL